MPEPFNHGYALLVGVGESTYPRWSLPATARDVRVSHSILTDPNLCAYPDDAGHVRLMHDAGASRQAILDGLTWLQAQAAADPQATAVVYYSGHGWLDRARGRYHLVPHDVEPFDLTGSALPAEAFARAVREIPARRLLVFVGSCYAEAMAATQDDPEAEAEPSLRLPQGLEPAALPMGLIQDLQQGEGRAVFTSSRGRQRSSIRPDRTMSIYAYHLVETLACCGAAAALRSWPAWRFRSRPAADAPGSGSYKERGERCPN